MGHWGSGLLWEPPHSESDKSTPFCTALGQCCSYLQSRTCCWVDRGTKPALILLLYDAELSCLLLTLAHTDALIKAAQHP